MAVCTSIRWVICIKKTARSDTSKNGQYFLKKLLTKYSFLINLKQKYIFPQQAIRH
jgi:hypothetical protein